MNGFYSVKFVAQLFDVSMQQIYDWIDEGKIIATKDDGGEYQIPESQFVGENAEDDSQFMRIDPTFRKRIEEDRGEWWKEKK